MFQQVIIYLDPPKHRAMRWSDVIMGYLMSTNIPFYKKASCLHEPYKYRPFSTLSFTNHQSTHPKKKKNLHVFQATHRSGRRRRCS